MIIPSSSRFAPVVVGMAAAIGGIVVAVHYAHLGLTLAHYDARGHLIVARRIADSLTPGWQQIGAIWLPLPHLLNAIPVQIDSAYRTGVSAVALSIAAFGVTAAALAWLLKRIAGSSLAAVIGVAVYVFNPNVLYLQSTPMTEPLLIALITLGVALLVAWLDGDAGPAAPGWAFALACLTRYEAWPVTAVALGAALWTRLRRGERMADAARQTAGVGLYPVVAILGFVVFSKAAIGEWFVTSGFFVPDNQAMGRPFAAAVEISWGAHSLSSRVLMGLGAIGLAGLAAIGLTRRKPEAMVALSLAACAALPWWAFMQGHPFRIRYMVPLMAAEAVGVGAVAAALLTWLARRTARPMVLRFAALAITAAGVGAIAYELRPLSAQAPMVVEATWDQPNRIERQGVTDCLRAAYGGETIMASMGSLGHYMQDASGAGLALREFLHEGNGDLWLASLEEPLPYVGWVLIEEKAEGGDLLAQKARKNPAFLDSFVRTCEGAGLALYRREDRRTPPRTIRR